MVLLVLVNSAKPPRFRHNPLINPEQPALKKCSDEQKHLSGGCCTAVRIVIDAVDKCAVQKLTSHDKV